MKIAPHGHACDRCGERVECCGDLRQLDDHENLFTCVEYERWMPYHCADCAKWEAENFDGDEPSADSVGSPREVAERTWKTGR